MNPLRSVGGGGGGAAASREDYGSIITVCAVDLRRIHVKQDSGKWQILHNHQNVALTDEKFETIVNFEFKFYEWIIRRIIGLYCNTVRTMKGILIEKEILMRILRELLTIRRELLSDFQEGSIKHLQISMDTIIRVYQRVRQRERGAC